MERSTTPPPASSTATGKIARNEGNSNASNTLSQRLVPAWILLRAAKISGLVHTQVHGAQDHQDKEYQKKQPAFRPPNIAGRQEHGDGEEDKETSKRENRVPKHACRTRRPSDISSALLFCPKPLIDTPRTAPDAAQHGLYGRCGLMFCRSRSSSPAVYAISCTPAALPARLAPAYRPAAANRTSTPDMRLLSPAYVVCWLHDQRRYDTVFRSWM